MVCYTILLKDAAHGENLEPLSFEKLLIRDFGYDGDPKVCPELLEASNKAREYVNKHYGNLVGQDLLKALWKDRTKIVAFDPTFMHIEYALLTSMCAKGFSDDVVHKLILQVLPRENDPAVKDFDVVLAGLRDLQCSDWKHYCDEQVIRIIKITTNKY